MYAKEIKAFLLVQAHTDLSAAAFEPLLRIASGRELSLYLWPPGTGIFHRCKTAIIVMKSAFTYLQVAVS